MSLADAYEAFLLDLDGVVWRGERDLPGVAKTIAALREAGKRVVFVTNNSSRTPRDYAAKLMRLQIPTENADVITSGHAVVRELRRRELGAGDTIHVLGGEGLRKLLTHDRFAPTNDTLGVRAVVVGWTRTCSFEDIRRAADVARSGVPFIASNADATYPDDEGVLPGAGAILAAVETAAQRKAKVVGKPRPDLFELALARAGVPASKALACGDRPETDLAGARAAGIPAALVLTGVTGEGDLGRLRDAPDVILDDLEDLLRELPRPQIQSRDGALVAVQGSDLATLECSREGGRTVLRELKVPAHLDRTMAWRVVRTLLLEAVAGSREVEASKDLRPYLERLGVDAGPQRRLFTT